MSDLSQVLESMSILGYLQVVSSQFLETVAYSGRDTVARIRKKVQLFRGMNPPSVSEMSMNGIQTGLEKESIPI
jgi:hypothetical protein